MKNVIFTVSLFIIFLYIASDECPFGLKDDPYPGKCGRYVDEDNNDVCDLSENAIVDSFEAKDSTYESEEVKENVILADNEGEGEKNRHGKNNDNHDEEQSKDATAESLIVPEITDIQLSKNSNSDKEKTQIKDLFGGKKKKQAKTFSDKYFLSVLLPLFIFAMIFSYLSKKKRISVDIYSINRWTNLAILIAFAVTAFTSIMLVLAEYKLIQVKNLSTLIFIHSFTGIIFLLLSLLHIYLKWEFYVTFFNCYIKKDYK
ncbi:MAG: DUF4405 domain-containing protein [bacterium]